MTLYPIPSEFPYMWGKFIFFFISVYTVQCTCSKRPLLFWGCPRPVLCIVVGVPEAFLGFAFERFPQWRRISFETSHPITQNSPTPPYVFYFSFLARIFFAAFRGSIYQWPLEYIMGSQRNVVYLGPHIWAQMGGGEGGSCGVSAQGADSPPPPLFKNILRFNSFKGFKLTRRKRASYFSLR